MGLEAEAGSGSAIRLKTWIRIRLKVKFRSFRGSKCTRGGPWTLKMEAWRLKMEPWRVFRQVVEDSHHFDEKQDPDLQSELHEETFRLEWYMFTLFLEAVAGSAIY
jgi:hypothetical protein